MSRLISDTDCELWYDRAEELGVDYIKMPYQVDGKEYFYDLGKNTDIKEFYGLVRQGKMPSTSALNENDYIDFIEPYFKNGEDLFYVSFSHAMSGTFNQLDKAIAKLKETYPERKITVFDTRCISVSAGLIVEEAAKLKKQGLNDDELYKKLLEYRDKIGTYFIVDDLHHLKRGGRLSAIAAFAGTALGLKPMLTYSDEGGLTVVQKITGRKKSISVMTQRAIEEMIEVDQHRIYVLDADCKEEGDKIRDSILEAYPNADVHRLPVGPVIGAHAGPGTLAIIFTAEKRAIPLKKGL